MAESKEYLKLWMSYKSYFEVYDDAAVGALVRAMLQYHSTGAEPEFDGAERFIWPAIKRDIDEDVEAREAAAAIRRENGKKGGRPPKTEKPSGFFKNQENLTGFLGFFENQENRAGFEEKEKESAPLSPPSLLSPKPPIISPPYNPPTEKEEKNVITPAIPDGIAAPLQGATPVKRFVRPTLAEVQSYVAERHSPVDPEEFIDFYEAKGWMVGKTPMKDWKAACRNAERWDRWARKPAKEQRSGNIFMAMLREEERSGSK